jgi:replicative DNA helicase
MEEDRSSKLNQWAERAESEAAEDSAIRLVLTHPDAQSNMEALLSMGISPEHFNGDAAKCIYSCAERLLEEDRVLGPELLVKRASESSEGGVMAYALSLFDGDPPNSAYIEKIAAHLIDLRNQRRVDEINLSIAELQKSESTWEEKKSKLVEYNHEIQELTKPAISKQEDPFDVIDTELDARDKGEKPANSKPIYTGMNSLDHWLRPLDLATADYYNLIFGISGNGKSSLAHMMFADSLKRGYRCAAFLGEVTADQMIKAIASQTVKLDLLNYEMEREDKRADFRLIISKLKKLWNERMFIYDDNFVIEEIVRRCRSLAKDYGKLDLVVIDHLHQLRCMKSFKDERLRYNYMSSLIKPLSMELKCPIVVVAQPNRTLKTENRPPRKSDLKETGNLEDDADRIWGIHIPEKDSQGMDQFGSIDPEGIIYQLKFKKGLETSARVRFLKKYTLFEDLDTNS